MKDIFIILMICMSEKHKRLCCRYEENAGFILDARKLLIEIKSCLVNLAVSVL